MSDVSAIRDRLRTLLTEAAALGQGRGEFDQTPPQNQPLAAAWLAAAAHSAALLVPAANSPYRQRLDAANRAGSGVGINRHIGEGAAIISKLLTDLGAGLLGSVADRASATAFDDLLDHAEHCLGVQRLEPAAVLAGVVFEDAVRRVFRNGTGTTDKDQDLDKLISALQSSSAGSPILSNIDAKQARVAAGVRTKATHAQWDEITGGHVESTIRFARDFISRNLDRYRGAPGVPLSG